MTCTDRVTTHLPFGIPHRPSLVPPCQVAPLTNSFAPCRRYLESPPISGEFPVSCQIQRICLKPKLRETAPSLTSARVLEVMGRMMMDKVWFRLPDRPRLRLPRYTQPEQALSRPFRYSYKGQLRNSVPLSLGRLFMT